MSTGQHCRFVVLPEIQLEACTAGNNMYNRAEAGNVIQNKSDCEGEGEANDES